MKLQHRVVVRAPRDRVWELLMDIPTVASCVPGVEALTPLGDDRYGGRFKVGLGPIRLALEGELEVVERDDAAGSATLRGSGTDRRLGGGVRTLVTLSLGASDAGSTEVVIDSDVQILGRIGELGQPIMKRKADEVMKAFSAALASRLT